MCKIIFILILLSFPLGLRAVAPKESLEFLIQGNRRFVQKKQSPSSQTSQADRLASKKSQSPFAVIVACSDSRVAPEILFDQGINDIFVIRVAGNVIGPLELESIEYAVKYLGSSCIVVMGHQNCGAVDAVINNQVGDIPFTAQIIRPSVLKAKQGNSIDILKSATEINAKEMSSFLLLSSFLEKHVKQGQLIIRAAYYDFQSGQVQFLSNNDK